MTDTTELPPHMTDTDRDIEAIRAELARGDGMSLRFIAACHPERIARLLAALEAVTKDAARYRWLRETGAVKGVIDWNALEWEYHDLPAMDAAIDASIRALIPPPHPPSAPAVTAD